MIVLVLSFYCFNQTAIHLNLSYSFGGIFPWLVILVYDINSDLRLRFSSKMLALERAAGATRNRRSRRWPPYPEINDEGKHGRAESEARSTPGVDRDSRHPGEGEARGLTP